MLARHRTLLFAAAALLAVVVAPIAAADAPAEAAGLDSFLSALAVEETTVEAPVCTAPATAPSFEAAPAGALDLACSCRDQCSVARNCDFVCGKGQGQCVMVNSCCRECICSATSSA
jgi:hypothetical protein